MKFFYICLFGILATILFHLFTKLFIIYKVSVLKKKNPKFQNYLDDDSDEWLNYLLDHNENLIAAYLYRKKYKLTLAELHSRLDEIKKNRKHE